MFSTCICIQMYVYIASYGLIYLYIHYFDAQEVHKTSLQSIHNQEACVCYTKQNIYGAAPPNFHAEGCSANPSTLIFGNTNEYSFIRVTKQV